MQNKKAISEYISWVLLILIVVTIAVIVATFVQRFSEKSVSNIQTSVSVEECNFVSVSVPGLCQKPLSLYINITNNNLITITELKFRLVYLNNSTDNQRKIITIIPGDTKELELLTQEIIKKLDIIPVFQKENKRIICEEQKYSTETIEIC
ncbi:hypothetical protein DRJ17_04845 [Candidatus Woesearchaeota archaeon]|nr:MAG: hypothetical protein DRJ17_04845 [Candidatus Woesearchaeota archaeon]